MDIKPTTTHGNRPADPQQLEAQRASEARKPDRGAPISQGHQEADSQADSVNLSPDAKGLAKGSEGRAVESSLSPDRLKEIGQRLASGYYDRPEVIDQVAREVAQDPNFKAEG